MTQHTEVLSEGGFKAVDRQRKHLDGLGIAAEVVKPPGTNPNT